MCGEAQDWRQRYKPFHDNGLKPQNTQPSGHGELPSLIVIVEFAATDCTVSTTPLGQLTLTVACVAPAIPKCNGWLPWDQNSPPPPPLFSRNATPPLYVTVTRA